MGKITLTAGGTGNIPGKAGRKALCLHLKTGDAVFGFGPVVTTPGSNEGIPMPPQQLMSLTGDHPWTFTGPVHFASVAGAEILYQEVV